MSPHSQDTLVVSCIREEDKRFQATDSATRRQEALRRAEQHKAAEQERLRKKAAEDRVAKRWASSKGCMERSCPAGHSSSQADGLSARWNTAIGRPTNLPRLDLNVATPQASEHGQGVVCIPLGACRTCVEP